MKNLIVLISCLAVGFACTPSSQEKNNLETTGHWRVVLETQGIEVPFILRWDEVTADTSKLPKAYLINGEEEILLDENEKTEGGITIPLHIFDGALFVRHPNKEGKIVGHWEKFDSEETYKIPLYVEQGADRFEGKKEANEAIAGEWEVTFTKSDGESRKSLGLFEVSSQGIATGTFLNATGDYRFLEGYTDDEGIKLSAFDGQNAYLFQANLKNDELSGDFYSGIGRKDTWTAKKNEDFELADADQLTYLKEGTEGFAFNFPNLDGTLVNLEDERFKDKIVIVQIFGSWCPNCMDEIAYLAPWYDENKDKGIEIVALSFERKDDFEYASGRVKKVTERYGANYPFLIAGTPDAESTAKALPMLNKVMSFPTTIFLNRKHEVVKIHTGFSGPGTGIYYRRHVEEFERTIEKLLNEQLSEEALNQTAI
ncbi:MAG: TlpA family protein disulfide reductase [Cyclobacteriaceae bacterium]|nr:TlpA family protein disulfide reductase [Cyclobacteriaceae bacterium]MCH8516260.1 TlpA family protein disulfide reductase [Cyclobacteriaceae bacterium]